MGGGGRERERESHETTEKTKKLNLRQLASHTSSTASNFAFLMSAFFVHLPPTPPLFFFSSTVNDT